MLKSIEEKSQTNNPNSCFKKLEKNKLNRNRRKEIIRIRVEVNNNFKNREN